MREVVLIIERLDCQTSESIKDNTMKAMLNPRKKK